MSLLIRVELLKLRTTRLSYGLLATATGLCAIFALLSASRAGTGTGARALPPLTTAGGLATVTTATGFALLLAGVLGITITTGEFRHGTATLTYLSFPHRIQVLTAKTVVAAMGGAIFGLAGSLVATVVGVAFAASKGPLALGAGTLAGHVGGAVLGAALFAAAGAALGSLLRSQLGAVIGIFAWGLVIETVIGGLFTSVRPYLPFAAATTLGGTALGNAALGIARTATHGAPPLPFAAAAALVLGVALVLSVLAAYTAVPRDIT